MRAMTDSAADTPAAPTHNRIAFLGGGNMARALIGRLLQAGVQPGQIAVGEPAEAVRILLERDFGVRVYADNAAALAGAQVVLLAVKPQQCATVITAMSPLLRSSGALLLSVAAGVRVANLQRLCPGVPVIRVMPNRAVLVGAGATGAYAPPDVAAANRQQAEHIFGAAGRLVWLPRESDIDLVTALSGSGPAYFFLLAEQLAEAASALGLSHDTAHLLAAETLYGAGQLAHAGLGHAADASGAASGTLAHQREAVTSRGGTTEAALRELAAADFNGIVARALQAAAVRSTELAALLDP
jgi:pyrroline-5-carboxylate reductase